MPVRAKFRVNAITIREHGREISASPVYGADGTANADWSKHTPSGELRMNITNPSAFGQFEVGKECFVEFTAPEERETEAVEKVAA